MKTPLQEIYAHLKASKEKDSFGETYCVDWLLENESKMLKKEKEVTVDFTYKCRNVMAADEFAISHWYDKTFNTEKK
jgi:hypothetical protein